MPKKEVYIDISARHIHLTREHIDMLFGEGYEITPLKELYGTGGVGFASAEQIKVVGPKGCFEKVRVLMPMRKESQVELSKTDARTLGVDAPVRLSGDLEGSAAIKLVGPAGEVELEKGAIVAKRHIHVGADLAEKWGLNHGDNVWVKVDTEERSIVFGDTEIRLMPGDIAFMHIDTDEANAAGMPKPQMGYIVEMGKEE